MLSSAPRALRTELRFLICAEPAEVTPQRLAWHPTAPASVGVFSEILLWRSDGRRWADKRVSLSVQNWQNIAPGASLQGLGANIWATTPSLAPQSASVDGVPCQLKSI